jgi:hypothetical protein
LAPGLTDSDFSKSFSRQKKFHGAKKFNAAIFFHGANLVFFSPQKCAELCRNGRTALWQRLSEDGQKGRKKKNFCF